MANESQDEVIGHLARLDGQHRRQALERIVLAYATSSVVARELGLSQQRIRQLVNEGLLDGVKVGDALLVDRQSLEHYKAQPHPKPGRRKKIV
jgi:ribosomal protein S14